MAFQILDFQAQHECHENTLLRQDNEKLHLENMAIKEAMRNPICTNCRAPIVIVEVSVQEQQLCIDNIQLKDEVCLHILTNLTMHIPNFCILKM